MIVFSERLLGKQATCKPIEGKKKKDAGGETIRRSLMFSKANMPEKRKKRKDFGKRPMKQPTNCPCTTHAKRKATGRESDS
jgi:hypothetical protein